MKYFPDDLDVRTLGTLGAYRALAREMADNYDKCRMAWRGLSRDLPPTLLGDLTTMCLAVPNLLAMEEPRRTEFTELCHFAARWRQQGTPVYQLTHGVADALLLTDPARVRFEDVAWPYDDFAVALPQPGGALTFEDVDGREVDAALVLVHRYACPKGTEALQAYYEEFQRRLVPAFERVKTRIKYHEEPRPEVVDLTGLDVMPEPWYYRTLLRVVGTSGTSIFFRSDWPAPSDAAAPLGDWPRRPEQVNYSPLVRKDEDALYAAHRLVTNLCLYLAALQDHRRPVAKRSSPKDPGAVRYDVSLVDPERGTKVVLAPEVREAAKAWCREGRDPTRWRLVSRQVVAGHWRRVPYGPLGDAPRPFRRRFIAPYKRGPGDTNPTPRDYEVKE